MYGYRILGSGCLLPEGGSGIWRRRVFFRMEKGCWSFFSLENKVLKLFCSLKFTNFLKDVILYIKQLIFMILTHSKGVVNLFCSQGVSRFIVCFYGCWIFFTISQHLIHGPPGNKWPLPYRGHDQHSEHCCSFNIQRWWLWHKVMPQNKCPSSTIFIQNCALYQKLGKLFCMLEIKF